MQVLSNLLINAAKYTPEGGHIYLWARGVGQEVLIGVWDNGVGIDGNLLPQVFEMFYQVQGSRDRLGLGLGLALVKSLVGLHGGSVSASSGGPGLGSEFVVRLPLSMAALAAAGDDRSPAAPTPDAGGAGRERILLVDDKRDAAIVLGELLGLAGHETRVVHDAAAALEACAQFAPTVAILDIGLPGIDGYQLARLIRQNTGAAAPRLIALSSYNRQADLEQNIRAGFETRLSKPVEPDHLLGVIAGGPIGRKGQPFSRMP